MESSCEPPDLEDDETGWSGRQVRQLLREALAAQRADLDRVRSFWMEQFAQFRRARDAAAEAALKAVEDEWSGRWARREDQVSRDLLAMRESVRRHVEEHWDNMEWHLDRTVDDCERQLRGVKGALEQKEQQLSRQRELNAGTLASLEEKAAQMGNVKAVLLLLKSRLEEKDEQNQQLRRLLAAVRGQLRRQRQDGERRADDLRRRLEAEREAGARARAETLRRQRRLLLRVDNVKSLVKGFVGHNARFAKSLKDTSGEEKPEGHQEEGEKEREKREKKEKKERDKREKKERKERQREEKKQKE